MKKVLLSLCFILGMGLTFANDPDCFIDSGNTCPGSSLHSVSMCETPNNSGVVTNFWAQCENVCVTGNIFESYNSCCIE